MFCRETVARGVNSFNESITAAVELIPKYGNFENWFI